MGAFVSCKVVSSRFAKGKQKVLVAPLSAGQIDRSAQMKREWVDKARQMQNTGKCTANEIKLITYSWLSRSI